MSPTLGLDVAALHGKKIVLTTAAAADDDGEETDHKDNGVGMPYKRGVRRGVG